MALLLCETIFEGGETQEFLIVEQREVIFLALNDILSGLEEEASFALVEACNFEVGFLLKLHTC